MCFQKILSAYYRIFYSPYVEIFKQIRNSVLIIYFFWIFEKFGKYATYQLSFSNIVDTKYILITNFSDQSFILKLQNNCRLHCNQDTKLSFEINQEHMRNPVDIDNRLSYSIIVFFQLLISCRLLHNFYSIIIKPNLL